jgi:hypothetical protein
VTWATIGMVTFRRDPPFAAHGRNSVAKEHGKKFVSRTSASDASLMHENNLVDQ